MEFIFKNKKVISLFLGIIIIALISILIYSNFIAKDNKGNESSNDDSNPKYVVNDAESVEVLKDGKIDYNGKTNKDVTDGEHFTLDSKGNKINSNSNLAKKHEVNGFVVTDLYLTSSVNTSDYAIMMFNIENTSNISTNFSLYFRFVDKDGKIIDSVAVSFPSIKKNTKVSHSAETYYPVIDAYDYTLEYIEYDK